MYLPVDNYSSWNIQGIVILYKYLNAIFHGCYIIATKSNTTIAIRHPPFYNCNPPTHPVSVAHSVSLGLVAEIWLKCLFLALLTQCLALHQNCTQVGRKTKNLTIQLQVSQSLENDLSGYISFMEVALCLINTNYSCVLPDYHISFTDIIDSRVSLLWHVRMLYFAIYMYIHAS